MGGNVAMAFMFVALFISPAGGPLLAIPQAVPMAGAASVHLNRELLVPSHKEAAIKGISGPAGRGEQPGPSEAQGGH